MSVKDYPNERDCEHGHLRRSCPICAAEADYAALFARHNALREAMKKYLRAHDIYGMRVAYTFGISDEANIVSAARDEVDRLLSEES